MRYRAARNIYNRKGYPLRCFPIQGESFDLLYIPDADEAFVADRYKVLLDINESIIFVLQEQYRNPQKKDKLIFQNKTYVVNHAFNRENIEWLLVIEEVMNG